MANVATLVVHYTGLLLGDEDQPFSQLCMTQDKSLASIELYFQILSLLRIFSSVEICVSWEKEGGKREMIERGID